MWKYLFWLLGSIAGIILTNVYCENYFCYSCIIYETKSFVLETKKQQPMRFNIVPSTYTQQLAGLKFISIFISLQISCVRLMIASQRNLSSDPRTMTAIQGYKYTGFAVINKLGSLMQRPCYRFFKWKPYGSAEKDRGRLDYRR